jgi:DinB superfamily
MIRCMDPIQSLRTEVDRLLSGKGAHADFDAAVVDFPAKLRGVKPEGAAHSAWQVLEHIRIAQWDMLEFSRDAKHVSPEWPEGYWPKEAAPGNAAAWDTSVKAFHHDLEAMRKLVADPKSDLFTPFAHGDGQTLLREAMQMADHNAYHVGELVLLRRMLGAWK